MVKKIILIGHFGVGKTSLMRRFVHSIFSEDYLTTIGVSVEKKQVTVDGKNLTMIIWDIAGETEQHKVSRSYYLGAHGIIYVFDISRPSTYQTIKSDLEYVRTMLPNSPIQVLGNKGDLVSDYEINTVRDSLENVSFKVTSAKSGDNVDEVFHSLAKQLM